MNIPRENSVFSLVNSYLELTSDILHTLTNNRYADKNDIILVNLGPIGLFSKYKLTISSGKNLENIEHGHIACLMYKWLNTAGGCDDLSIGFDCSRGRRQREVTNNKNTKDKYHVRIYLKDIFAFAQHQLNGTYGLGYILKITRNNDSAVLKRDYTTSNAKIKLISLHWYVPLYTPSIAEQAILFKHIQIKKPTELRYPKISIFMKEVNIQSLWSFELGTHEVNNVPICIFVGFQQKDRQDSQKLNNDTFLNLL